MKHPLYEQELGCDVELPEIYSSYKKEKKLEADLK